MFDVGEGKDDDGEEKIGDDDKEEEVDDGFEGDDVTTFLIDCAGVEGVVLGGVNIIF